MGSSVDKEKERTLDLMKRALALRHKLKVHDSMPLPPTHEEIAASNYARWELEDELHAIEELLRDIRSKRVADKRQLIEKEGVKKKSKK